MKNPPGNNHLSKDIVRKSQVIHCERIENGGRLTRCFWDMWPLLVDETNCIRKMNSYTSNFN